MQMPLFLRQLSSENHTYILSELTNPFFSKKLIRFCFCASFLRAVSRANSSFFLFFSKARRQIAEFINTEVQSDRFTSSVSDSLQAAETLNEDTASKLRNTIALKVRENITQTSSQILKGTFVQSEKHDAYKNQVIVTVVTGVGSVDTSNQLMKLMSQ